MLALSLSGVQAPLERVLVIGCHADDAEIGCGATLLGLLREHPGLEVTWVVLAAAGDRGAEARASAEGFLAGAAKADVLLHDFRDGFMPYRGEAVKEAFEDLKDVEPDLVLTHTRADLHQDHRLACELTWNTFRDHLVLEYEIPKVDGDLGTPNLFVPVSEELAREKVSRLLDAFSTQRDKHWFDADVFLGLMRLRGMECRSPSGYAEAFVARKVPVTFR
jgi:LmbE family N-acetylglucosaminyl deacetylase